MATLALTNTFPFNSGGIGNPTARDILKGNPDADILKLDGLIYSNVSDREWLDDHRYTKGEKLAKSKSRLQQLGGIGISLQLNFQKVPKFLCRMVRNMVRTPLPQ